MDLDLNNKVIIVTGAAGMRGSIGQTIVKALASERAIPVLIDRNKRGFEYQSELNKEGIDSIFIQTDMTKPDQIEQALLQVVDKYGRIDALINNVGVNDGVGLDASYEDLIYSLHLNLISYFLTTKYALPELRKSKGNILNIGSKVALTGQGKTSGYAASKGGVLALTREWAVDLINDGVRSNCLIIAESWTPAYQNWVDSQEDGQKILKGIEEKIPFERRMTTAQEIADTVLFLVSSKSSHTTGQFVFVDGGYVHLDRALIHE